MNMKRNNHKHGFTLIEALVAVAILALSVGGPMYAASRALVAAQIARDKLTASYLAQEGVEYVRMLRDNLFLYEYSQNSPPDRYWWDFRFGTPTNQCAGTCKLDPWDAFGNYLVSCSGASCSPLYIDSSGRYTQDNTGGNEVTSFTRTITIAEIPNTDQKEQKITATVQWTSHGNTYNVTLVDIITPWE